METHKKPADSQAASFLHLPEWARELKATLGAVQDRMEQMESAIATLLVDRVLCTSVIPPPPEGDEAQPQRPSIRLRFNDLGNVATLETGSAMTVGLQVMNIRVFAQTGLLHSHTPEARHFGIAGARWDENSGRAEAGEDGACFA